MKRITSLLAFFVFIAITASACSNVNSENEGEVKETKTLVAENPSGEADEAKPEYLTKETFKEKIWDYEANPQEWIYEGSEPAIIDFYADWCKPCKMVAPILDEISTEYAGKVKVYKIDTQVQRELAALFQVTSIPAFLYIPVDGKPQMDKGFKQKDAFVKIINEVLLAK
jgi:thioredoxin